MNKEKEYVKIAIPEPLFAQITDTVQNLENPPIQLGENIIEYCLVRGLEQIIKEFVKEPIKEKKETIICICGKEMEYRGEIINIDETTSRYYYCPWCGRQKTIPVTEESNKRG